MEIGYVRRVESSQSAREEEMVYDEIQKHLDFRFVCHNQAAWRLLEKDMQGKSHHVERLPIHLPGEHTVYLEGDEIPESEDDAVFQMDTKLIAYFKFNSALSPDDRLLYSEMPRHCTWHFSKKNVCYLLSMVLFNESLPLENS
jgi:hypothetical protein